MQVGWGKSKNANRVASFIWHLRVMIQCGLHTSVTKHMNTSSYKIKTHCDTEKDDPKQFGFYIRTHKNAFDSYLYLLKYNLTSCLLLRLSKTRLIPKVA